MIPGMSCAVAGLARSIMQVGTVTDDATTNATAITIDKPTGIIAGDMLLTACGTDAAPAGWTTNSFTERYDQGAVPNLVIGSRVAGGSEASTYTFDADQTGEMWGLICAFRDAAWDTIGSAATLTGNGNLVMPAITSAGGVLFAAVCTNDNSPVAHSTPSGMALVGSASNGGDGVVLLYKQDVIAGTTGTRTCVISGGLGTELSVGILFGLTSA